jgi:hypothetical protein
MIGLQSSAPNKKRKSYLKLFRNILKDTKNFKIVNPLRQITYPNRKAVQNAKFEDKVAGKTSFDLSILAERKRKPSKIQCSKTRSKEKPSSTCVHFRLKGKEKTENKVTVSMLGIQEKMFHKAAKI